MEEQKELIQEKKISSGEPSKECSFNLTEDDIKQEYATANAKINTSKLEQEAKAYNSEIVQVIGSPHLKGVKADNFIQIDDAAKSEAQATEPIPKQDLSKISD